MDDQGAATPHVYARALFTVPLGRNNTMFRIEFANHASEKPHPPFRVIFRHGADDAGMLASRAVTVPFRSTEGKIQIMGTATGLQPGQAYTLIVRDVAGDADQDGDQHADHRADQDAYDPRTYQVTSVSVA